MSATEDRGRLISRAQELHKAVSAYAETLPDDYEPISCPPTLWADIRNSVTFIQIDEDVLCTSVSDVTTWTHRNLTMYLRALEMSAIGLGIIPPKAAEIQWKDRGADEVFRYESDCGNYLIEKCEGGGYKAYYEFSDYHREDPWFRDTLEAAKQACQDHKQNRLEELL